MNGLPSRWPPKGPSIKVRTEGGVEGGESRRNVLEVVVRTVIWKFSPWVLVGVSRVCVWREGEGREEGGVHVEEILGKGRRGVVECVAVNTCACGGPEEDEGEECCVSLRPRGFFSRCELVNDSNSMAEWRHFKTGRGGGGVWRSREEWIAW